MDTISEDPRRTIRPEADGAAAEHATAVLTRLDASDGGRPALELEGVIGRGGTGLVREAVQTSLRRKVAVKGLRPEARSERNARNLMHEGWVTGALEHPNVVPVYDMGVDADGHPLIVLKRISGDRWTDLLANPDEVRRRFDVEDPFEWHLRTLMQVCTTVAFAHSRRVVHRDLKPDNVMLGPYGEVYVLDWGIAISMDDDPDGRLPSWRQATRLAGTPCYMAPEMLGEDPPRISERTDVYLLGAILYEIVCEQPPHDGPSVHHMLQSVVDSNPSFPPGAPPDLVAVCRKALSQDPADRHEGAEALRADIQRYLDRRGSMKLAAQAERSLAALETEAAAPARYELFGECRFGFRQALDAWPENERARKGLLWATRSMVEYELERGEPDAAEALLAEMPGGSWELEERVRASRAEVEQRRRRVARLERLDADMDLQTGTRTRAFIGLVMGLGWIFGPLLREYLGVTDYDSSLRGRAIFLATAGGLAWWARESMFRTAVNRRLLASLFLVLVGLVLIDLVGMYTGLPAPRSYAFHQAFIASVTAMNAIKIDNRRGPTSLVYFASFGLSATHPEWSNWCQAGANALLTANIVWIWRPRRQG